MKKTFIITAFACVSALFIGCGAENNAERIQNRIGNVSDSYLTDGYWDNDTVYDRNYADRIVNDYASDFDLYDNDAENIISNRAGLQTNNRLGNSYYSTYRYNPITKRYETLPYYDYNRNDITNVTNETPNSVTNAAGGSSLSTTRTGTVTRNNAVTGDIVESNLAARRNALTNSVNELNDADRSSTRYNSSVNNATNKNDIRGLNNKTNNIGTATTNNTGTATTNNTNLYNTNTINNRNNEGLTTTEATTESRTEGTTSTNMTNTQSTTVR